MSPLSASDPRKLGEYQLVGRLGTGGMGVVYLAESEDGPHAAIKLIHPALAADPEFSGRFRSEVERARQVPSFCTAGFLGADLEHDPPYLVVEYVDGPSLLDVVRERGPLLGGALYSLAVGVATALTGIHGAGVIHRDLKPENVLLPPGSPKVIDFGIAQPFVATSQHTRADMLVGTVAYMAPERFSDDGDTPLTAATDVFAWGCVVTYAATGRTPFQGDSSSATAGRILTQPPRIDGLPGKLRDIVALTLSKDPADRPTAPELLAMLVGEKAVPAGAGPEPGVPGPVRTPGGTADGGTAAGPAPRPARSRRRLLVVPAVLALTGLTAAGLAVRASGDPKPAPLAAPSVPAETTTATGGPSRRAPAPGSSRPTAAEESRRPATESTGVRERLSATATATSRKPVKDTVPANPSGRNLALGRPVTASSTEGSAWSAARAVDGDPQSRWGSAWSDVQWLRIDLGTRRQITEIVLRWEHAHAVAYRVEVSADGTDWTSVYRTSTGEGGDVTVRTDGVPGRYVRMSATERSGKYGYSLYEVEVR
ncbi:serine/threonine protein kinase [Jidongwangia harbinensis]|uniref:serine/threonine protein kinase n=1 Tax=Jidongwangia harbinensis TaxID=2878561 RepID=UPI001CDA2202|nr:protein kinase [Jidongwangia harbinensis]MCA2211760.1 discoidin domain-containing protein [Jidongwangia harbinensis]